MKTLHKKAAPQLLRKLFRLERCGKYDEALVELRDIWNDTTKFPDVEEYESRTAAEIILRCGALIGFLGHNKQIPNSQEKSKNLLTEARNRFLDIYDVEKVAECENYLARAYWQTGELTEAEIWIEEALSRNISNSNCIRLYSYIIQSKIDFANSKYEKILQIFAELENDFLSFADTCLKGDFYNHYGLALRNIGKTFETLEKYELAIKFHQQSGHKIYLGTIENNRAYLYKSINKFSEAHEAIDNATKIFKLIKDRTREGFSLDTKAQIYFSEGKFSEALKTADQAIAILSKSENKGYLVESIMTKAKTLLYLKDDVSLAVICMIDAVQIARANTSEEKALGLIREFEKIKQEKISNQIEKKAGTEHKTEIKNTDETVSDNLELILPPSLTHYTDLKGVWIANNHLEKFGLQKGNLAIVADEEVKRGDLVAINEIATDSIICGFYDYDFGIVCVELFDSEIQMFDEKDIEIFGKIIGVSKSEKNADGKMTVEPLKK